MKTTHSMASGLFLVLSMAGCANLPMDQACRANIEKETKVLAANGHRMQYHRSANFPQLLSAAQDSEQIGDYPGCLNILQMAHIGRHNRTSGNYARSQRQAYSGSSNQGYSRSYSGGGGSIDAAHHAAGHTHHHGH